MSTQPTPQPSNNGIPIFQKLFPNLNVGKINKTLLWASHYVKTHEIFLGAILAGVLLWGISGKITDLIAAHDKRKADQTADVYKAQAAKNQQLAAANDQLAAQVEAAIKVAVASNTALEQANARLATALEKQKATDATLPPADLANRIQALASLPPNSITPAPGNTFAVSNGGAVQIAQTLEAVPVLQQKLANVQQEKLADDGVIANQGKLVDGLNAQITGLNTQIKDGEKAHAAEIASVKAEARKGKRKWFVAGYVAGLATRGIIKIFGGV